MTHDFLYLTDSNRLVKEWYTFNKDQRYYKYQVIY